MRTVARTARGRAVATLAGLGVLVAVPLTVQAASGDGLTRGDLVTPTKSTPAAVKSALKSNGPVVVAFLLPGITEDEIVQKRLNTLQKNTKFRDTKFIVYRITGKTRLGDLPTMFSVKYTPAVVVIQGDDKLSNVWRGLVDEDIIAQSLIDARAAVPQRVAFPVPKGVASGDPAGIALAKRVNAHYATVPGVSNHIKGPGGDLTAQLRLVDGKLRVGSATGTVGGVQFKGILNATGSYQKKAGAACWTRSTARKDLEGLGSPVIAVQGVRFAKPVKSKDGTTVTLVGTGMAGQYGAGRIEYTIAAKTADLVRQSERGVTLTVENLAKAPAIHRPQKIC